MKTISYSGGLLKFRVPSTWLEEYDEVEGGTVGAFYEDVEDSGTLELTVLTLEAAVGVDENTATEMLLELGEVDEADVERLPNGNAIAHYAEEGEDDGEGVFVFHWLLANVIPPAHGRIAAFTYTILSSQVEDPAQAETVKMLDHEIRNAHFHPEVGELDDI